MAMLLTDESKEHNTFRNGELHVVSEKCSTCIFRPGNHMNLAPGRVKGLVAEAIDAGSVITCHKTLMHEETDTAVCRGYFDAYFQEVPVLQIAKRMNIIRFDEPCQST